MSHCWANWEFSSCLWGWAVTTIDDRLLKHRWELGRALGLHWKWELSSSHTWVYSVRMLWLPVALTLRMETHSLELWEILLLGQSYSSCTDLVFFQEDEQKLATWKDNNDEQKINLKSLFRGYSYCLNHLSRVKPIIFHNGKLLKCRYRCVLSLWTLDHAHKIKFRRPEVRLYSFLESSYRVFSKASGCSAVLMWPFQSLTVVMFLQLTNSGDLDKFPNASGMKIKVYFILVWSCAS